MNRRKPLVLDTNVLINDALAFTRYTEGAVFVPIFVVEELDGLKKAPGELGAKARSALRALESHGPEDVIVWMPQDILELDHVLIEDSYDNKIMQCAVNLDAKLITEDVNMRIRARALGLETDGHHFDEVTDDFGELCGLMVPQDVVAELQSDGCVTVRQDQCTLNESIVLVSETDETNRVLGRVTKIDNDEVMIEAVPEKEVWGLKPRNVEQAAVIDAILDPAIDLITIAGKVGSGKTICAIAAAMHLVLDAKPRIHEKLIVARPIVSMGNELGFLPGMAQDKLAPWMRPIFDALTILLSINGKKKRGESADAMPVYQYLLDKGIIEIQSLEHIRGASIPNAVLLIDEGQNMSPHEAKTIVTRAGENTKVIITGDPDQIDSPKLSRDNNGLTYVANKFKGSPLAAHLKLQQVVRSRLASEAADRLN